MTVSQRSIITPSGVQLYLDDLDPQRYYIMPTSLDVAIDEDGEYRFSLLFYQTDFPERGARLVMALSPKYPQLDPEDAAEAIGADAEVVGIPFGRGEIQLIWPAFTTTAESVQAITNGLIRIETSLTQPQASALRQLFEAGADSVRVSALLAYAQTTEPLPVTARIKLKQTSAALHQQVNEDTVTGMRLRTLIADLPGAAVALKARGEAAALARWDLLWKCTPALAPMIAAAIADQEGDGMTFDDRAFRLRQTDQVEDAEVWIDLSRPRPWTGTWSGEWSLTDFRRKIEAENLVERYFPQVLHVPPVGLVPVLVENLLTVTSETVREVRVDVKHRELGSLEENLVQIHFTPESGPVTRHEIPNIAFTPFRYQYRVSLEIAPETPDGQVEIVPPNPQWQETDRALVQIGTDYMPYAWVFASAREGVFGSIGRAEIEFAAVAGEPPAVLSRTALTADQPHRWLLVRSLPSSTREIRWRPLLFQDPEGGSEPVVRDWRTEPKPWAVLDPWDVYPREPVKVKVTVHKGDAPEIQLVTVLLRSGSHIEEGMEPEVDRSFFGDETRTFTLWPETIFDQGFVYRYGVALAGGDKLWTVWKPGEGGKVEVNVEDEFYFKRTIEVTMRAPWSEQRSPDPSTRKGEIIYAEVHLSLSGALDTQSRSFTFDTDNKGACLKWNIRGPRGAELYSYEIHVLSLDGRLLEFGPYESNKEQLALEIIRTHVSDFAPPEFNVRERET